MREEDFRAGLLKKVKPDKLEKSLAVLQERVGEATAVSVRDALSDGDKLSKLLEGLGEKEAEVVIRLLNSPEALKKILSSPRIAEMIQSFVTGNRR